MIGFIIGTLVGGTAGVTVMCLCRAAAEADGLTDRTDSEKKDPENKMTPPA